MSFDFVFAKLIKRGGKAEGPFDAAFVEGAVTESWQADELKKIRECTKTLFAIGSCAIVGGVPAIKSTVKELEAEKRVYGKLSGIHSLRPHPVDDYVKVDGYIRGCPPGERDVREALVSVLTGIRPAMTAACVCVECKIGGNPCLLVARGMPCMGPVTVAGCGALCPSVNRPCFSCFGPHKGANARALRKLFREMGMSDEDIKRRFTEFGACAPAFMEAASYED